MEPVSENGQKTERWNQRMVRGITGEHESHTDESRVCDEGVADLVSVGVAILV